MGTDNKEVAWILLDEDTKPIRVSFDNEPTYVVENDTNYTMNVILCDFQNAPIKDS